MMYTYDNIVVYPKVSNRLRGGGGHPLAGYGRILLLYTAAAVMYIIDADG